MFLRTKDIKNICNESMVLIFYGTRCARAEWNRYFFSLFRSHTWNLVKNWPVSGQTCATYPGIPSWINLRHNCVTLDTTSPQYFWLDNIKLKKNRTKQKNQEIFLQDTIVQLVSTIDRSLGFVYAITIVIR